MKNLERYPFRTLLAGTVASIALLGACKGESQSACITAGVIVEIDGTHGHEASVPADHVKRGLGGTYPVSGEDHKHVLTLRDADMQKLQRGEPVETVTSSVKGHTHGVTLRCKD